MAAHTGHSPHRIKPTKRGHPQLPPPDSPSCLRGEGNLEQARQPCCNAPRAFTQATKLTTTHEVLSRCASKAAPNRRRLLQCKNVTQRTKLLCLMCVQTQTGAFSAKPAQQEFSAPRRSRYVASASVKSGTCTRCVCSGGYHAMWTKQTCASECCEQKVRGAHCCSHMPCAAQCAENQTWSPH